MSEENEEIQTEEENLLIKNFNGENKAVGYLLNAVIAVFCVVLVIQIAFNVFYTGIYVVNISMRPTFTGAQEEYLPGGDFIYINRYKKPSYGDVVVVYRENGKPSSGNIIKRVVAFENDTVEILNGVLYVNDEIVVESYVDPERNTPSLNNFDRHVVKEGCMFLLGDNRNESTDSRERGDYPVADLVGVMPQWSYSIKGITTAVYTFFNFTVKGK